MLSFIPKINKRGKYRLVSPLYTREASQKLILEELTQYPAHTWSRVKLYEYRPKRVLGITFYKPVPLTPQEFVLEVLSLRRR